MKVKTSHFLITFFLIVVLSLAIWSVKTQRLEIRKKAIGPPLSNVGDFLPDKVFGQPDFTQTNPNQIVGNRAFHPQGVIVDRNVQPNRVYILDSGNSRILGFSSLGNCQGSGNVCTNNLDCPNSTCVINETKNADIVIGQTDFFHGTCNGDNTERKLASASTLCFQPYPATISLMEAPETMNMALDSDHNLYVLDKYNNRVLKYLDPFTTDRIVDKVWGQPDFTLRDPNRGGNISNNTLNLSFISGGDYLGGGAEVDPMGNVWVTDIWNHRILRFPASKTEADLVIGQPNFTSNREDACIFGQGVTPPNNFLCRPKAVRYNTTTNQLFVIDWPNGESLFRVLIFDGPNFTNGMAASKVLLGDWDEATGRSKNYPYYFRRLTGIEIDPFSPADSFWLSNTKLDRLHLFKKVSGQWTITKTISNQISHPGGSMGIDSDGNLYASDILQQDIKRFTKNGQDNNQYDKRIIKSQGSPNYISGAGFRDPSQTLLVNYLDGSKQMFVSDRSRVLFWNDYDNKSSGSVADGVLFEPNQQTVSETREILAITKDSSDRVWMAGTEGIIYIFKGPISQGDNPIKTINTHSPIPLKTSGTTTVRDWILGLAYNESEDALWVADNSNHRLIRISNPLNSPLVDMVIGQPNNNSYLANRGIDNDDNHSDPNWQFCPHMSADGFGTMGGIFYDNYKNLYVVDGSREGWQCSNNRLLEFDRQTLIPDPNKIFFQQRERVPKRVYGGSDFTSKNIYNDRDNIPFTPIAVTFSSKNEMIMAVDGYGNNYLKRSFLFPNPLPVCATPCRVSNSTVLAIPGAQLSSPSFDKDGNLVILDHTWNRVLFFNQPLGSPEITISPSPSATPVFSPTPVSSPTVTPNITTFPTPTSTIIPTVTVSPTPDPNKLILKLKINFFGVWSEPNNPSNLDYKNQTVKVSLKNLSPTPSIVFTQDNVTFQAKTSEGKFYYENPENVATNVLAGTYHLLIKGPKHLQRKYKNLNLATGLQTLDFSGNDLSLPGGDLPLPQNGDYNNLAQDGKVNSLDYAFIVNNFNKTETNILTVADLNLDGIINTGDASVLANTLSEKIDTEE